MKAVIPEGVVTFASTAQVYLCPWNLGDVNEEQQSCKTPRRNRILKQSGIRPFELTLLDTPLPAASHRSSITKVAQHSFKTDTPLLQDFSAMSVESYREHGIHLLTGSMPPTSIELDDSADAVAFKHKGFRDVTVIKDQTAYGKEEEMVPTSEYLPPAAKRSERALRRFDRFSVIVRRIIQRQRDKEILVRTELCIQSGTLCKTFRNIVIDTHDSFDINSTPIVMPAPFYELFYRREEIKAYTKGRESEELRSEVKLLHDFFRNDKLTIDNMAGYDSMISQGKINCNTLWTLYPPNELLFLNTGEAPDCWRCRDVQIDSRDPRIWWVHGAQLGFNGRDLGLTRRKFPISFIGKVDLTMEISELPLVPERYFESADQVSADIIKRGKTFQDIMGKKLDGHKYRHHQGSVWASNDDDDPARIVWNERVVVDYKKFISSTYSSPPYLEKFNKRSRGQSTDPGMENSSSSDSDSDSEVSTEEITNTEIEGEDAFVALLENIPERRGVRTIDDLLLLSPSRIPAYGLKSKRWGWVLIQDLTPVSASSVAFDNLQIDEGTKSLVKSLVNGHQNGGMNDDFDDVISNKGKGLVIMLHGKPGIGKTLMAESMSELNCSPLYSISGGELSVDVGKVEAKLTSVFDLGTRWKAIVLLDEADVVMTKRSSSELEKNAIIAGELSLLCAAYPLLTLVLGKSG
ncbi:hypothetical protein CFIO01_07988 [Colletotrichum fioriniae PJ7]|uniref:Uncharacterized protein n=1 Tax=Colletotrichum fioriniae PJ7 TaxID=1445577 RepID=A0A010RV18_9PEZI|nr:hypothetical protein CFIO01_07988 [Colletotrichum fioriniae PJ7]